MAGAVPWDLLRLPAAPSDAPEEEQSLLEFVQRHFLSAEVTGEMRAFCVRHAAEVDLEARQHEHNLSWTALHEQFLAMLETHLEAAVLAHGSTPQAFAGAVQRAEEKTGDIFLRVLRESFDYRNFARLLRTTAREESGRAGKGGGPRRAASCK